MHCALKKKKIERLFKHGFWIQFQFLIIRSSLVINHLINFNRSFLPSALSGRSQFYFCPYSYTVCNSFQKLKRRQKIKGKRMNFISLGSLSFGGICLCFCSCFCLCFCFPPVAHSAQCSDLLNLSYIHCLLGLFTQVVLWKRKNGVVYYTTATYSHLFSFPIVCLNCSL